MQCDAEHYLEISPGANGYQVCYQRYTRRYPLEFYDEGAEMPVVILKTTSRQPAPSEDGYAGPILVFPRKRRFSKTEIQQIWTATNGRCHLCRKHWRIAQRGRWGWHVDHVIPHIGGGMDTEEIKNLRVACWRCNLTKGRGYTELDVRRGLQELLTELHLGVHSP